MTENKKFKKMSTEEQVDWLNKFTTFANSKFPMLQQIKGGWSTAQMELFESGLRLLDAFPRCRNFVAERLFWKDYPNNVSRMDFFITSVKKEISKGYVMKAVDGERLVYVPTANIRSKRGRPTREEAAAAAAAQAEIRMEEERAKIIAELNGATPMERSVAREKNNEELLEEKRKEDAKTPSLFSDFEKANEKTSALDLMLEQNRPHLDQISFLLSPGTAADVKLIRQLRTELSECAERAKLLAEQGKSEDEVARYASRAYDLNERIESIYLRVDTELAQLYILLPIDTTLDGRREAVNQRNLDDKHLIALLKPYYTKISGLYGNDFEKKVIAEYEASRPEVVAAKKAESERKKEVAALRKYIMREDKKASETRVKGIRERIERLKELGEDVAEMELILNKTIEEAGLK